ncbi:MAG: molecular chaperone DnaK, partial [Pseudomonadota bacterium]
AIAELKTAMEGEDAEEVKAKIQALTDASMKLGEAIYKAQAETEQAQGAESAEGGEGKAEEDVVDADFTEVKDDEEGGDRKAS